MPISFSRYAGLLILGSFAAGCASIVSGTTQEMSFQSNPDGALVTVNGRELGKTPIVMQLKRGSAKPLTFSKDGYKTVSMQIDSELNPWFWGDIVCGGLYGSTTDGLSGAMHKYAPGQFMVTLTPLGATSIESHTALSENQKIKEFVVVSYRELQADLQKGAGPYLSSLLSLLKTAQTEMQATVKKVRALADAYPTIPEFADRVTDLAPKSESAPVAAPVQLHPSGSVEDAYDRLLTAYNQNQAAAESMFNSFGTDTKSELKVYVLNKRGKTSASSWKFDMPMDASENEKRCLRWYVKSYTDYKPDY